MTFADHFSDHADSYREYRPKYPPELFEFLASIAPSTRRAWDVGTGNGQAAVALARYFDEVIATDASAQQIRHAEPHPRVDYRSWPAEHTQIAADSVALVTVAQALHWFDLPRFYAEVRRVGSPQALLAVWCYELHQITPEVDAVIANFYANIVGPYWPPERRYIEERYRTIPFPFDEVAAPAFAMRASWSLSDLCGYLSTWSAVKRLQAAGHADPIPDLMRALSPLWGSPGDRREVVWPLHVRIGRAHGDIR